MSRSISGSKPFDRALSLADLRSHKPELPIFALAAAFLILSGVFALINFGSRTNGLTR